MKIFISYASEDIAIADALATGLRQDGHTVFFDRDDLRAGEQYHARIRDNVAAADLFVFLITPQSVRATSYALTELQLARERWPDPSHHVLPVLAIAVPPPDIPPYLNAVTYLKGSGNIVANVLARVADIAQARRRRRVIGAAFLVGGITALAAIAAWWLHRPSASTACNLSVTISNDSTASTVMIVDVTYQSATNSFTVSPNGIAQIRVGPLRPVDAPWTLGVRSATGEAAPPQQFRGCPAASKTYALGNGFTVTLAPR